MITETIEAALAAALAEWKPAQGPTLTALRRYALRSRLSGHSLRELKDALTLEQMVAERNKLDRPLVKGDYVNLLTETTLQALTEKR
jgi:hypothetical protein